MQAELLVCGCFFKILFILLFVFLCLFCVLLVGGCFFFLGGEVFLFLFFGWLVLFVYSLKFESSCF